MRARNALNKVHIVGSGGAAGILSLVTGSVAVFVIASAALLGAALSAARSAHARADGNNAAAIDGVFALLALRGILPMARLGSYWLRRTSGRCSFFTHQPVLAQVRPAHPAQRYLPFQRAARSHRVANVLP